MCFVVWKFYCACCLPLGARAGLAACGRTWTLVAPLQTAYVLLWSGSSAAPLVCKLASRL